jgi:hypothetical protein
MSLTVVDDSAYRARYDVDQRLVRAVGLEPTLLSELDFESSASTNFTTPAARVSIAPSKDAAKTFLAPLQRHGFHAALARFAFASRSGPRSFDPLTTHIHGGRIDHVLDMRRVEFLDHLDAGAAVLSNLIDVGALHQPHRYVSVPQAIRRPLITFPVTLQTLFAEDGVQQLPMGLRKEAVGRLR